jgi:hypothetical protein
MFFENENISDPIAPELRSMSDKCSCGAQVSYHRSFESYNYLNFCDSLSYSPVRWHRRECS